MPLYDFQCSGCSKVFEEFMKVDQRQTICGCGSVAYRKLSIPFIRRPMQPYQSPIDGRWIESDSQRRDDLARSGCVPYDPEMKKDVSRAVTERETKLDKFIDEAVEKTASELSA